MPKPRRRMQTYEIRISEEIADALPSLTKNQGGWQTPYQYMAQTVKRDGDGYVARVRASDLEALKKFALNANAGTWERRALDILKINDIDLSS